MKKIIFGKSYLFDCEPPYLNSLRESFKLYEDVADYDRVAVQIFNLKMTHPENLQVVPREIHKKTSSDLLIVYPQVEIHWFFTPAGQELVIRTVKSC